MATKKANKPKLKTFYAYLRVNFPVEQIRAASEGAARVKFCEIMGKEQLNIDLLDNDTEHEIIIYE